MSIAMSRIVGVKAEFVFIIVNFFSHFRPVRSTWLCWVIFVWKLRGSGAKGVVALRRWSARWKSGKVSWWRPTTEYHCRLMVSWVVVVVRRLIIWWNLTIVVRHGVRYLLCFASVLVLMHCCLLHCLLTNVWTTEAIALITEVFWWRARGELLLGLWYLLVFFRFFNMCFRKLFWSLSGVMLLILRRLLFLRDNVIFLLLWLLFKRLLPGGATDEQDLLGGRIGNLQDLWGAYQRDLGGFHKAKKLLFLWSVILWLCVKAFCHWFLLYF